MARLLVKTTLLITALTSAACAPPGGPPAIVTSPPAAATATLQAPAWIGPTESWIEIDLARQTLALHEGGAVRAEYLVSTGVTTDPKYATPPDLYRVQSKDKGPVESAPGVFVSDIVMFDLGRGNGIHSLPMDAAGTVLDATVGTPATAGCVRLAESAQVFEFARIGMRVWIH